jgi:large subunit ribosomal protein L9
MELILRQDVDNLGFRDDIVDVKNGYARNFLIPTGQAVLATSSAKKVLAENLKQRAYKEAKLIEDANVIAETIKGYEIKIGSKVGSGDKLFGSVNNIDLAAALGGSVKRLGKYEASVRLHRAVVADITFEVVAE